MKALLSCAALALAALAVTVEPARACSCIQPDPWKILPQADGAFVGSLVSRRETDQGRAVLTFRVERRVKGQIGSTVEVTTANNGAACGIEAPVGQRVGLFLLREGGRWIGHLCWVVEPADLLAAAALPAPNGRGPAAMFVAGRFGPARTIALDANGRTLAYGMGSGSVQQHAACPGGRRVAELVQRRSGYIAAIRELPTLWLVREQPLPKGEGVPSLRCIDVFGEKLAVFLSSPNANGRLVRVTPRSVTTLWRGGAFYASFWKQAAVVQVLAGTRTKLLAVDLRNGSTRALGAVRVHGLYELTPNAIGTMLAGDSYKEGIGDPRLVVIDLASRRISARTIPLPAGCCGVARWIRNDRFAYISGSHYFVYSPKLQLMGRILNWPGGDAAFLGGTAYGVRRDGALVRAERPYGPVRIVRRLPGRPSVIASAAR